MLRKQQYDLNLKKSPESPLKTKCVESKNEHFIKIKTKRLYIACERVSTLPSHRSKVVLQYYLREEQHMSIKA